MTAAMLAAIEFDPHIRGILVVLTGTVVLMGSIYMILATNSGARVGFLVAAAGFTGWMVLMGIIWVIYGIGLVGRSPEWMPTDINFTRDVPMTQVPDIEQLPPQDELPNAEEMLEEDPLLRTLVSVTEGEDFDVESLTVLKTIVEPWIIIEPDAVADLVNTAASELGDVDPEVEALLALPTDELTDEINERSEAMRDEIQEPLGEWCLLTESDPRRGEAVASSDAAIIDNEVFESTSDYIVLDVFFHGGKEPCEPIEEFSMAWRVGHRVYTTLQVKNPELRNAVTLVKAQDVTVEPGQAPPPAAIDEEATTMTVVSLRNLGNKRAIPFMFTIVNLAAFIAFCTVLHFRDKRLMDLEAAFAKGEKD